MTTLIAAAVLSINLGVTQDEKWGRTAVLPMTRKGGGMSYTGAGDLDVVALVRPVGSPVVRQSSPDAPFIWYVEQRFVVLDSPDGVGADLTAYYMVHGVYAPTDVFQQHLVPAQTLPLDEGKYLLIGTRVTQGRIKFTYAYDGYPNWPEIAVEPGGWPKVTLSGLFPVNGVTWAESGPRWRFVMETVAATMANARAGALDDMTHIFRRLLNTDVPRDAVEGLDPDRNDMRKHQEERLLRIVREVLVRTEATATTEDKVYIRSVLAHYSEDVKEFIDVAYRLLVVEKKDMPDTFVWPTLTITRDVFLPPPGEPQRKLLEIAEKARSDKLRGYALSYIGKLDNLADQRRFFALVPARSVGERENAYKKLIKWLALTGITVLTEDDGHGRTVRITNEDAVRAAISARLGI